MLGQLGNGNVDLNFFLPMYVERWGDVLSNAYIQVIITVYPHHLYSPETSRGKW